MATTTTTRTDTHAVRWSGTRSIRFLTASAIVAVGLAIVWTGSRNEAPTVSARNLDPAAVTAGLSQETLSDELTAIHGARVSRSGSSTGPVQSGLSQELLAEELTAIRGARVPGSGSSTVPVESGLYQELLAEELAAIRAR